MSYSSSVCIYIYINIDYREKHGISVLQIKDIQLYTALVKSCRDCALSTGGRAELSEIMYTLTDATHTLYDLTITLYSVK